MKKNKGVVVLIPTRLNSRRLPAKALLPINKMPLVIHVYKRAKLSKKVNDVIICCDGEKILKVAKNLTNEKNVTYVNKEIFKWLSNSNEKHEIAICSHVIEHLDDPIDFLNLCKSFFV